MKIVTNGAQLPIQPANIDTSKHFWDAFGNMETEISALWIVSFCQKRRSWDAFTLEEVEAFYNSGGFVNFRFNKLTIQGFIVYQNNTYHLTEEFIKRCHLASPA